MFRRLAQIFKETPREKIGETTAGVEPPFLLLLPASLPLESAKICVICGFSNSFTPGDLQHIPSESLPRNKMLRLCRAGVTEGRM
jgi:hypothetical protein